ncbi:MAG: hypothetical protein IKP49_04580 [Treponema sp.]|nr:hypothetical protein [Treponema sp.]
MKNINNYKCLSCGGGLKFDPKSGGVICEYCDSQYTIEQIEEAYGVQDEQGTESQNQTFESSDGEWNTENLNSDWGEDSGKMKEFSCPSCGASILCEATTAATSCPYCDNPTVIEKEFAGNLKPDYVIPFKLNKKEAIAALKEFYKGKKLLPKEFSDENHLEEMKGVYVPFWFFNGTAEGSAVFHATTTTRHRSGNTETITTKHYDCNREGSLEFNMVPVDASKKMPNDMMDSLEPFDFGELKEFSTAYLPGYLADKYDDTVDECFPRAETRCAASFLSELQKSVKGYGSVTLKSKNISLKKGIVNYGLVPVYLLYTKWHEERYLFSVNGQTGKVVGKLPLSSKLATLYYLKHFFISFAAIGAIAFAVAKFMEII